MVLDDLGDSLKGTIKKIANAVHIDKKLIKEVVRDIQRALLQSDVNVKLVLNLSKTIEKRALEEKPAPGMSNREHVIRIVYDELVKIIGDSKELPLKKQIIMMVGLYGNGKCVHGDSIIPLTDGNIKTAKEIYDDNANINNENILSDGYIIDISKKPIKVPSFNPLNLKIENKNITHLWKLKGKDLYKISLDSGNDFSVSVTPEHPFFILRNGLFIQARADQLSYDDYIAVPRKIHTITKLYDVFNDLQELNIDIFLNKKLVKEIIYLNFDTLKEANNNLIKNRNYCKFTQHIKKGRLPISFIKNADLIDNVFLKIKFFNSRKTINFPRYITKDLSEFIGYVIGDGHVTKTTVEISNADKEIISRVKQLSYNLFNIRPCITRNKKEKAVRILISSKTLSVIFHKIFGFPYGKKGRKLHIPKSILNSPNDIISRFIRAYFDCDGYVTKKYRNIEAFSESKPLIKELNLLLLRFNIFSAISKKEVNSKFYYRLSIQSRFAEEYYKKFGSLIKRKNERLSNFLSIGKIQGCGKFDMIPIKNHLKDLRQSLGHSIGSIQDNSVNSYGIYEKNGSISRESLKKLNYFFQTYPKGNMLSILDDISKNENFTGNYNHNYLNAVLSKYSQDGLISVENNLVRLSNQGNSYLLLYQDYYHSYSKQTLNFLNNLAESNVCWIKVKKIEKIKSPEYVYDFTVEDNHSFIADGIIVHNTTSCGKLATYFKKKGLRPALIAGDVHRPAAYDQLKQIAEQVKVPYYGDKDEKDAVKVVERGLKELKKSNDIIIVDTSGRHKLEDDLIDEMKNIFKAIKPDEKLLIIDAAVGQQAGPQAKAFNDAVDITGIVLTKLDGTAKGGGALSAASEVDAPIVFIGTGEHPTDFEKFDPAGFISRLLGMGDIKSLLEKAKESLKGKDAEKAAQRMISGKFNLHDLYDQMDMLAGMGPLKKVTEMLPGSFPGKGKLKDKNMQDTEDMMQKFKIIMDSMTEEEMNDPNIIRSSRIKRIAKGAGVENKNVKELLKYYKKMKQMMKVMSGNRKMRKNLMNQLQFGK